MRVYVVSLGCPKNQVDTERLLGALGPRTSLVERVEEAELALVATCAFIQPAVEESIEAVLDVARDIAESNPAAVLAVAGCLGQRYGVGELAQELPEVDYWLDPADRGMWPREAMAALAARRRAGESVPHETPLGVLGAPRRVVSPAGSAFLKVSEGCDHACAFCAIPNIKGRHRSFAPEALVEEAAGLLIPGGGHARELTLVGQDLTAYGRVHGVGKSAGLIALLEKLLPLPGLDWLRCMYLYPAGLDDELLAFFKANADPRGPLLPYLDIPLQHAHPEVLRRMGRPFAGDPWRVVERVRAAIPDAVIRTTFIVGYPGETESQFQALKSFVEEAALHHVGVFPYWPEEGTRAATLSDQVSEAVKGARAAEIMEAQQAVSQARLEPLEGEMLDVLVEAALPDWPGLHQGRVWLQAPGVDGVTYVSGEGVAPGALVSAEVHEAKVYDLVALV